MLSISNSYSVLPLCASVEEKATLFIAFGHGVKFGALISQFTSAAVLSTTLFLFSK